jgi:FkbM family methyltransferase
VSILNSLGQIVHSESVGPVQGVCRHFRWQVRKLLHQFPCELHIANSRLYIDRAGGVAALVNAMGEYDYNNMRLLCLGLSLSKSTFFDVGANIGSYSLIASELPDVCVVSIEPHPRTFFLLEQNVHRNARSNVTCLNLALSREEGEVWFTDKFDSETNSVVQGGENGIGKIRVPCRRLDSICRELNLYPDFIKVDVEGYEDAVLEGLGNYAGAAKIIFIEGGERQEVRNWMQKAGYSGPWFSHFNRRLLSREKQPRPEDPLYVQNGFIGNLREMKFAIG